MTFIPYKITVWDRLLDNQCVGAYSRWYDSLPVGISERNTEERFIEQFGLTIHVDPYDVRDYVEINNPDDELKWSAFCLECG